MSSNKIFASIVINNFNYGHFLEQAINSALAQTYSPLEVVVVDDGSQDHSRQVIESFGDKVIAVLKENGGQASTFNEGFERCKGDIIFFLDSDDYFCADKVEEIIKIFSINEDIDWCFHSLHYIDDKSGLTLSVKQEEGSKVCDFRNQVINAKSFDFHAPATSGLTFKRGLLENILPMPTADSVNLSDLYLKTLSMGLAKGYYLDQKLAVLRVHEQNRYTQRNDKSILKAEIDLLTGYWIRKNFPCFRKTSHQMFLRGMRGLFATCSTEHITMSNIIQQYIKDVSVVELSETLLRQFYYQIKFKLLF